ncbi:GNAT family N-acetyltransferase [Photobacterium carnosum]|uniref:GNAT family N-acetyltransferase n=1 Tax=Photobacterium carnosum TaxID=2023717 RepID=UPI001E56671F|nr:GNAT family N-acetyltransferase [Photobacterium carnosum]MCD9553455.1 GNAT family N-acetyltransferase [Photobacterium carnosum]
MKISPITSSDWHQIEHIQHLAYGDDYCESMAVLTTKIAISPQTCFVCLDDEHHVVGYLISHPCDKTTLPQLNQASQHMDSTHLHLHDLAITPASQGQGLPYLLINHLFMVLKIMNYQSVSLISVQNSTSFWNKFNFIIDESLHVPACYGSNAIGMSRLLST